jgi:predicted phosphatase
MIDPRDNLGRMTQPFGDMHHEADRARRRAWVIDRMLWGAAGAAFALIAVLISIALLHAGTMQPPSY